MYFCVLNSFNTIARLLNLQSFALYFVFFFSIVEASIGGSPPPIFGENEFQFLVFVASAFLLTFDFAAPLLGKRR